METDPHYMVTKLGEFVGEHAMDIGAHHGQAADILCQRFAHVYSYEPSSGAYLVAIANRRPNQTIIPLAISNDSVVQLVACTEQGDQLSTLPPGYTNGEPFDPDHPWGEPAYSLYRPAWSIDDHCRIFGQPDFIKVDTEGHEWKVIFSGLQFLLDVRPALYIEVHHARWGEKITDALRPAYGDALRIHAHRYYRAGSFGAENHYYITANG